MQEYRIGFVLEQVLGHVTHSLNIQRVVADAPELKPFWLPMYYEMSPREARLPLYNNNWSVRAGWKVRRSLSRLASQSVMDGLFIHTQVLGVLIPDWLRRYPTVISLDASPLQYDQLGNVYGHSQDSATMEQFKFFMNRRMFRLARHLVTWTSWAKDSLVKDYGISPQKITVIPPGVDLERFKVIHPESRMDASALNILFVGGDFKRKGGPLLLEAFRTLRESQPPGFMELHLVTYGDVPPERGVFVHQDLRPGDPRLIQQFGCADIFVLPTEGDCLPMVLAEAGASALPIISTRVGGIPEIVMDGETGLLVGPGDGRGLVEALTRLINDAELRRSMGARARQLIYNQHNATANVRRLLTLIEAQVDDWRQVSSARKASRAQEA